jgi:outer membrane protein assembly factor BamE (lipoprotein component of BamABCDE complex)
VAEGIVKPRLRIRLVIDLVVVLVAVAIAAIVWPYQGNDRITKENLDRIADGLTQAEVEEILGPPTAVGHHHADLGTIATWDSRQTENHLIYLRVITLSFDPSGRKRAGQYTNCQVDIDAWLSFKFWVADGSPWLAKKLLP